MAHPQIAIFARLAEGGAKPVRQIHGHQTLLGRTTHAIAYDEIHDEIVVPQQFGQAILTFRGGTSGEEPPLRIIQGPQTQLEAPDRLGIDPVNNEIYVPESGRLLVYPREANGNVAPVRVLSGDGGVGGAVAIDAVRNLIVTSGSQALKIFDRKAKGPAKPLRVIGGPRTREMLSGSKNIAVYPPTGLILVANEGTQVHAGENWTFDYSEDSFVGVWSINDHGDIFPRWTIGGPYGALKQARGIVVDPKNKSIIVSDKYLNAVLTYHFPEMF